MIFLGCSEAEMIFLGCLKISWTDPPVCVSAECPPLGEICCEGGETCSLLKDIFANIQS